jgi:anti-sigma regulatory factor (Ser/Thr protein kinase)
MEPDGLEVRMQLDLPDEAATVPLCRRAVRLLLEELGVEAQRAGDIELVVSEAAGNAVRHAHADPGHRYEVSVEIRNNGVCVQILDEGRGFHPPATGPPHLEQLGGRGLWLMEQLADEVTISTLPEGGCRLEAVFHCSPLPMVQALLLRAQFPAAGGG